MRSLFYGLLVLLMSCASESVYQSTKPITPSCGIYLPNTPYVPCPKQEKITIKDDVKHEAKPPTKTKPPVIAQPKQQVITSQPTVDKPKVAKPKGFSCEGKSSCGEMNTCAEARFYLNSCGVRKLDRDSDGVPCESICN